jgi:hypothetical protein
LAAETGGVLIIRYGKIEEDEGMQDSGRSQEYQGQGDEDNDLVLAAHFFKALPGAGKTGPEPRTDPIAYEACRGKEEKETAEPKVGFAQRGVGERRMEADEQSGICLGQAEEAQEEECSGCRREDMAFSEYSGFGRPAVFVMHVFNSS